MKLLRTMIATVLLLSMLLPLASCGSSLSKEEETVTTQETETVEQAVDVPKPTRYPIKELEGKLKLFGERTMFTDKGLLALEWVGSGFELTLNAPEGGTDVWMNSRFNYSSGWQIYVDGVQNKELLYLGNGNLDTVIATVDAGVHTVKIIKDTQAGNNQSNYNNIVALSFFGEVMESDQTEKDLYLEFVGDALFSGYGNMGSKPESLTIAKESSYQHSVPYLTSSQLDADYSVVSHSGLGLVKKSGDKTIFDLYNVHNGYRDLTLPYTPDRVPDAIIIHVGQEESVSYISVGNFILKGEEFMNTIRSYYGEEGKNIPIVWVYGTFYYTHRTNEVLAMAERNNNVYAVAGAFGRHGAGPKDGMQYPNAEEHQKTADLLVPFLKDLLGR